jgi:calcium-dependent protein kinase
MSVAELDQLFRSIDKNNSGFIDYTEFESASMKRDQLLTQKHLEEAFTMIDIDGNGRLSR